MMPTIMDSARKSTLETISTKLFTNDIGAPAAINDKEVAGLDLRALPLTISSSPSLSATGNPSSTSLSSFTTSTISQTGTTAATSTRPTKTSRTTQVYYPPASSQFALSVPSIIGVVIAGVSFLVLCAIVAAFTVCYLDRKKENKTEKKAEEDKKEEEETKAAANTENSSAAGDEEGEVEGHGEADSGENENVDEVAEGVHNVSVIGPRYARMIGVNTSSNSTNNPSDPNSQPSDAAKGKGKQKERERMIVHLPVHVSDLGTPRQSLIQYEREDPGDDERDERGFRKGASWWHPEL